MSFFSLACYSFFKSLAISAQKSLVKHRGFTIKMNVEGRRKKKKEKRKEKEGSRKKTEIRRKEEEVRRKKDKGRIQK